MAERIKSLEETLKTSVGGACAFPETLKIPVNTAYMKVEPIGMNGDVSDDLRFERDVLKMVKSREITEEEAQKLLDALRN